MLDSKLLLTVNPFWPFSFFFLLTFYFCLFLGRRHTQHILNIPSHYLVLLCLSLRSQWFLFNLCSSKTLITIVRYDFFSNAPPYFILCSFYIFWVSPTVLSVPRMFQKIKQKCCLCVCRWICVNKECWSFVFDIHTVISVEIIVQISQSVKL